MREHEPKVNSPDTANIFHPKFENKLSSVLRVDQSAVATYLAHVGANPEQIGGLTVTLEAAEKPARFLKDPNNLVVQYATTGDDYILTLNHLLYGSLKRYAEGKLHVASSPRDKAKSVTAAGASSAALDTVAVMSDAINSPGRPATVLFNVAAGAVGYFAYEKAKPKIEDSKAQRTIKYGIELMEQNDGISFVYPRIGSSNERFKDVTLEDVGGLESVKEKIEEIAVVFNNPDIMEKWDVAPTSGVLLYGEAGTGKTMVAYALAHRIGAEVMEIQGSEVIEKWVGSSGRNLKKIFDTARKSTRPLIILINEFESLIGHSSETDDGASQERNAVAGQFKTEAESLPPNVLLVATTNHYDEIEDSLVRSGRFDYKIPFPKPSTHDRQEILIKIVAGGILRTEDLQPEDFAAEPKGGFRQFGDINTFEIAKAAEGMSGADLVNIFNRIKRKKVVQEARGGTTAPISQEEVLAAIHEFHTSG
jgi:SpoVK/Ycf46/Vps4 family AAA+-type ATPase